MKINKENINHIIPRYLNNELDNEEKKAFEFFLNENPEYQNEVNDSKKLWDNLSEPSNTNETIQLDDRWLDFEEKIVPEKNSSYTRYLIAAAIIIFSISLFTYFNKSNYQIFESKDNVVSLKLYDDSEIELNQNSKLTVLTEKGDSVRHVLLSGEAYFKIAKSKTKSFIVETKNAVVRVLGTEFNLYNNNDSLSIYVNEGKVSLENKNVTESKVILSKNHFAEFKSTDLTIHITNGFKKQSTWRKNVFEFNEFTLDRVFNELEKHYHKKIIFDLNEFKNVNISARFSKEKTLEQILNSLSQTNRFSFKLNKDKNVYEIWLK
jgi:transmembrane sensor